MTKICCWVLQSKFSVCFVKLFFTKFFYRHGLGRTDYYLLNDPDLSFQEILRKKVNSEALAAENKDAIKLESHEDILKFDKDEILVKLEKGEGTLKIEKVAVKKETSEDKDKKPEESSGKVELTLVKNEKSENEEKPKVEETVEKTEVEEEPIEEKKETPEITEEKQPDPPEEQTEKAESKDEELKPAEEKDEVKPEVEQTQETSEKPSEENPPSSDTTTPKVEETSEVKEKVEVKPTKTQIDEETDLCSKQAAELKAMFPDLEVIQPLSRLSQVDTFVLRDKQGTGALDFSETTVAQLFNNAVKWPKEYAIQVRLQHIIYAIETKEWPATKSFSAYATGIGNEFDIPIHELPNDPPKRDSSTPMSLGDDMVSISERSTLNKKRKRHIAIDVETERAKLHALLNSSHMTNPKHGLTWDEDSEDSRRSTPVQGSLQPPPAHQQTGRMMTMPYDKYDKYHSAKTIGQTTVIPGTSSTLTPIDLSSR